MNIVAKEHEIAELWARLQEPAVAMNAHRVACQIVSMVDTGYALGSEIEDLLYAMGLSLTWSADTFRRLFGLPQHTLMHRPSRGETSTCGFTYTAAADVAALLIMLERCGLPVDPLPLVDELLPKVKTLQLLSPSELRVLWYRHERRRCEPVTMVVEGTEFWVPNRTMRLPTGYRAEARFDGGDEPKAFTITAPRYRSARVAA